MVRNNNEVVLTIKTGSKVKTKEGKARARASNNPVTPNARAVDKNGKNVEQEDRRNKGAARALLWKVHHTSSKFEVARAAPQTANMTTAHTRMILRQMGQAEARGQTRLKFHFRRNISSTLTSQTRTSKCLEEEAKAATMRAWKGLGATVGTTASNVIGIAIARINTWASTGLAVYKSKYQNPQANHFTRKYFKSKKFKFKTTQQSCQRYKIIALKRLSCEAVQNKE